MSPFRYHDLELRPGERGRTRLPVAQLAGGYRLSLPLHAIHGALPGPTLLVVGVVHGEEIFAIDAIRLALQDIDPEALRGTLLAVPVANPPALASQTRNNPLDMLDLNRQFPGSKDGWLSERIAAELNGLVDRADALLHIDGGSAERVIHYTFVKQSGGSTDQESERLSRAFGMATLYRGPQASGSLTSYAAERGIPAVLAEVGGSMLYTDPGYLERAAQGVRNVAWGLGMLDEPGSRPTEQRLLTRRVLMRVPEGGIFHPAVGIDAIDRPLAQGTLLGSVLDPYTLETVATLEAPYARSILLQMRVLPTAVQPGDYAFIVADLDSAVPTAAATDRTVHVRTGGGRRRS